MSNVIPVHFRRADPRPAVLLAALIKAAQCAVDAEHDLIWRETPGRPQCYFSIVRDRRFARCHRIIDRMRIEGHVCDGSIRKLASAIFDAQAIARRTESSPWPSDPTTRWLARDALANALVTIWKRGRLDMRIRRVVYR